MNETGLASNSFQPSGKHANKLNVTCFFGSISIIRPFKTEQNCIGNLNLKYSEARYLIVAVKGFLFSCFDFLAKHYFMPLSPSSDHNSLGINLARSVKNLPSGYLLFFGGYSWN